MKLQIRRTYPVNTRNRRHKGAVSCVRCNDAVRLEDF